jgi:hypothetical protein
MLPILPTRTERTAAPKSTVCTEGFELARLSGSIEATAHRAKTSQRELRARLEDAEQAKKLLHHEGEQIERERRALELNLREVLGNLRHAAQEAQHSRSASRSVADEATLVPSREPDNGW